MGQKKVIVEGAKFSFPSIRAMRLTGAAALVSVFLVQKWVRQGRKRGVASSRRSEPREEALMRQPEERILKKWPELSCAR